MINALGHVREIHGEGDVVYKPPTIGLDKKNFAALQISLMKELLGDKYVLESQGNDAANENIKGNQPNFINLDDLSQSNKGNPQSNFMNFMNTPLISISQFLTTLITFKNMGVKWKESNAFNPMLKLVNKNSKVISGIIKCIQCHTFGN